MYAYCRSFCLQAQRKRCHLRLRVSQLPPASFLTSCSAVSHVASTFSKLRTPGCGRSSQMSPSRLTCVSLVCVLESSGLDSTPWGCMSLGSLLILTGCHKFTPTWGPVRWLVALSYFWCLQDKISTFVENGNRYAYVVVANLISMHGPPLQPFSIIE